MKKLNLSMCNIQVLDLSHSQVEKVRFECV